MTIEQLTSKEKVLPKTELEWIAHALNDAAVALPVLFTMLAKIGAREGAMVADEILGHVKCAQKQCGHLVEAERRAAHEPPAGLDAKDLAELRPCYSVEGLTAFIAKHHPALELRERAPSASAQPPRAEHPLSSGDAIACIGMALQNPDTDEWPQLLGDCMHVIERMEGELLDAKRQRNAEVKLRQAAERDALNGTGAT